MDQNKVVVPAKIGKIPSALKKLILKAIDQAAKIRGKQVNVLYDDVSYLVSVVEEGKSNPTLLVSVCDYCPVPNAGILPMLKDIFGEPSTCYAKPWIKDSRATFLIMMWDNPNFRLVKKKRAI